MAHLNNIKGSRTMASDWPDNRNNTRLAWPGVEEFISRGQPPQVNSLGSGGGLSNMTYDACFVDLKKAFDSIQ